jgi:hypothetical protein
MSYPLNHREALEKVASICRESETYTRRTQHIHEVAMRALGMTLEQRMAHHMDVFDRTKEDAERIHFLAAAAARHRRIALMRARLGAAYIEDYV